MQKNPSAWRCLASFLYECVLVFAILFVAGLVHRALLGDPQTSIAQHLLFVYLWIIAGAYFIYCWTHRGETLAMKTWRIRLVSVSDTRVLIRQALVRYILATFSLMFFGAGFLWRFFDREGLFLHDRIAGTRLILISRQSTS
jgi:uncharacterized RDD family membrane protein YckC